MRELSRAPDAGDDVTIALKGALERMLSRADRHPGVGTHVDVGGEDIGKPSKGFGILSGNAIKCVNHGDDPSQPFPIANGDIAAADGNTTRRHIGELVDEVGPVVARLLVDEAGRDVTIGSPHGNRIRVDGRGIGVVGPVHEGVAGVGRGGERHTLAVSKDKLVFVVVVDVVAETEGIGRDAAA